LLLGFILGLGSASLLSGCGDDSKMTQIENAPDPAEKAKDSMDFYKGAHIKGGDTKKKN
jgi:hypothetical protein